MALVLATSRLKPRPTKLPLARDDNVEALPFRVPHFRSSKVGPWPPVPRSYFVAPASSRLPCRCLFGHPWRCACAARFRLHGYGEGVPANEREHLLVGEGELNVQAVSRRGDARGIEHG